MNRNNGREIGERLNLLRDFFIHNADKTRAVKMEDLQQHLANAGFEGKNGVALDKKTIYRDLDALKTLYQLEIKYVEKQSQATKKNYFKRKSLEAFSFFGQFLADCKASAKTA